MTRFGLSTTVFGEMRLGPREIDLVAAHGFPLIEVAAGAGRFDLLDPAHVAEVRAAVASAGLEIAGVSVALADASAALPGVAELGCALLVARAGGCAAHGQPPLTALPDAAALRRAIEQVSEHAAKLGVALAIEFPARLPAADAVELLESLEAAPVGACLDMGHAHLAEGAPEAIELLSGYILTTHLHDNHGREDGHRAPFSGSVDWPAVLMELWKTGFAGPAILEVTATPDPATSLTRVIGARARLQAILDDLAQPMVFPE